MEQQGSFIEIIDQQLASSNARLPVFNATALKIQQEIAKDEPDIRLIERLIVSDQSLTAKVCLKMGIGMAEEPDLVLVATPEAKAMHICEVDLAQLEIMLEDSQVISN